ncbi:DUF1801 domain-containing protein [Paenibacillus sp. HB172176]|uniref:DUF1801 domain-containing protein n=1 Tax=Paenibacillus sp. HB172176 TaxID=2493690 RepID=UPI0014391F80|nr:DUF1801 domain-containing protein [Paenibacillus sp. HB172176]
MSGEVTTFIEAIDQPWQAELCTELREIVLQAIPEAQERMQYKKPHFLKNGKYAAVISTSKAAVSFTIFHADGLTLPEGLFEGPSERKTIKLKQGQTVEGELLVSLLRQASAAL